MRAKLKKGVEMVRRWRTMGFLCLLSALFLFLSSSFVSFTADRLRVIRVPDEREGASGERKRREPELGYLLSHQSNASLALSLALLKKKKTSKTARRRQGGRRRCGRRAGRGPGAAAGELYVDV